MACYLVKSNPNNWRIFDYLRDLGNGEPESWTVSPGVKAGDVLFMGASGEKAAIIATGVAASSPAYDTPERDYFVDHRHIKQKPMCKVNSFRNLITNPVTEAELKKVPELTRVAQWLHIQGGYTVLSDDEFQALERLTAER